MISKIKSVISFFSQKIVQFSGIKKEVYSIKVANERLQDEIDTLHYFLNSFVDIYNIPYSKYKDLRMLQQCDARLLNIICNLFDSNHLTYMLAYGSLLGAVRHKGFIPWDDDMDIWMPREDFEKAFVLLQSKFRNKKIFLLENFDFQPFMEPNRSELELAISTHKLVYG